MISFEVERHNNAAALALSSCLRYASYSTQLRSFVSVIQSLQVPGHDNAVATAVFLSLRYSGRLDTATQLDLYHNIGRNARPEQCNCTSGVIAFEIRQAIEFDYIA